MKKRIIIGLGIFSLVFFLGGTYIILSIQKTTETLDRLITLHRVEILREHLLIHIKRVQSDLDLRNTRYTKGVKTMMNDVQDMVESVGVCFDCHHSESVAGRLNALRDHVVHYEGIVSRALTIEAGNARLAQEEEESFTAGEALVAEVDHMITTASTRLHDETNTALKAIGNTNTMLFILAALAPILATGLGFILIRAFTKPLSMVLDATRRLRAGELDFRITGLKDEYGEVAESFNNMASSLKEQMQKMYRTEQIKLCGELATGLAHEIKNPLAGIKTSMEVLSSEICLAEEDKDVLVKVVGEIKRIELLIKDLLNFARPPRPQLSPVDVNNVLESALTFSLRDMALPQESKAITVVKDLAPGLPEITADPMQLKQIFLNLLLNARDAMPDGGTIKVKTRFNITADSIQTEISDTGKGIDEETLGKIFQPFFTTKSRGTGLGLAVTRRLVEEHRGTIRVSSAPGKGTTFMIDLPVSEQSLQVSSRSGGYEK